MTSFKKRTLFLSTGKEVKLYGNSFAIGATGEIGEGAPPNIFFAVDRIESGSFPAGVTPEQKAKSGGRAAMAVHNPHDLTAEELMEIADYNMGLWLELKANLRKFGVDDARVFLKETP